MADPEGVSAPPPPRLTADNGQYDAFVRDILEIIDDFSTDVAPTMATVVRMDGGRVVVHIDGERLPRTVGFAKKAGVIYSPGDRVGLKKTKSGEWIVDGIVSSDVDDGYVGPAQIIDDAIGYNQLAFGIVSYEHLNANLQDQLDSIPPAFVLTDGMIRNRHLAPRESGGGITSDKIALGAILRALIGDSAVGALQIAGNSIAPNHLSNELVLWLNANYGGNAKAPKGSGGSGHKKHGNR